MEINGKWGEKNGKKVNKSWVDFRFLFNEISHPHTNTYTQNHLALLKAGMAVIPKWELV